jgi:hypothetical protein
VGIDDDPGDPWRVLGLEPTASLEDARRAFRLRAQVLHPDRHQGSSPAALAEAERAMRELTAAWTAIQQAASSGDGPAPTPTVQECLDWFVAALVEAGPAADDPVSEEDVRIALEPVAVAARRADFDAWCRRRQRTLAIALAADRVRPDEVPPEWQRCYDHLRSTDVDLVLLLLLDHLLGGGAPDILTTRDR